MAFAICPDGNETSRQSNRSDILAVMSLEDKMSEAVNNEHDRREAYAHGDLVLLEYNRNAEIWELKFEGDSPWLLQLDGFESMNNPDDNEKVNAILGSKGLKPVGPGVWTSEAGLWHGLVTRLRS